MIYDGYIKVNGLIKIFGYSSYVVDFVPLLLHLVSFSPVSGPRNSLKNYPDTHDIGPTSSYWFYFVGFSKIEADPQP